MGTYTKHAICRVSTIIALLSAALLLSGCNQPLEVAPLPNPVFDLASQQRLRQMELVNLDEVLQHKGLDSDSPSSLTVNPYAPQTWMPFSECWDDPHCHYSITETGIPVQAFPGSQSVFEWWQGRLTDAEQAPVCAVRFLQENHYELSTFENRWALAAQPEFQLTHYQACGACSTLQDLAVYGTLDLTVMAKTCSKRMGFEARKACMEQIGFSEACSESWAYNAGKTSQSCLLVCVQEYGLLPLLTGTESSPNNTDGALNRCLQCDEMMSGPGFQYSAGRTRRNSGIESEIDRPDDQVYEVSHDYF